MTGRIASFFTVRNLPLIVLCISLGVPIGLYPFLTDAAQPAVTLEHLSERDGVAVRGGTIDLVATIQHHRACPVQVERWLWRQSPIDPHATDWVPLGAPTSPPTPVGDHIHYHLLLPLPANIEPGTWFYKGIGRDGCSWLPNFLLRPARTTPDVPVRIQNPTAGNPAVVVAPPAPVTVIPATP